VALLLAPLHREITTIKREGAATYFQSGHAGSIRHFKPEK
jgi:hypothetical protein